VLGAKEGQDLDARVAPEGGARLEYQILSLALFRENVSD
jgi:hypothetical protein